MKTNITKVKSTKGRAILTIAAIATLLMSAMNFNINSMNVNAFDIDSLTNADDIGQSLECVIVVVGCDGTGSVGSSGDTIIGSNNGNDDNDNNTNGGNEPNILTVSKVVECQSANQAICDFAVTSANYPGSEDYAITVTGNNPNPSSFPGNSAGTDVAIGVGDYTVDETLASTSALQSQLSATSIITTTDAEGDCTPNFSVNNIFEDATGTMTSGSSQECTLINTITIIGGTVPTPSD